MNEIILKEKDVKKVLNTLSLHGIALVKNYLSSTEIESLKNILIDHLNEEKDGCHKIHKHPLNNSKVGRYQTNHLSESAELVKTKFINDFTNTIVQDYYKEYDYDLCSEVFFTNEQPSSEDILPWHFDRIESLKFYINLVDVNEQNGAFQYDIGSHREGHMIANQYLLQGVKVSNIPNDVPDSFLRKPTVIEANAGDLIVFDAAGFHKAGKILQNRSRMVIRAHSHPKPSLKYSLKPFSSNWFAQKIFAFNKALASNLLRKAPDALLEKLKVTRKV